MTLQIGTSANHVGTHFWNLQDEYLAIPPHERELSPATFFREVSPQSRASRSGLRYAPRLQIIDSTGAFGALSTDAGVVLDRADQRGKQQLSSWTRGVQHYEHTQVRHSKYVDSLLEAERHPSSAGQDVAQVMDEPVNFWSDFLKTRLHPRSCFPLRGVHHNVTNLTTFEAGKAIATSSMVEDAYDELRFFIEDCDSYGGLILQTDADNAYAGISTEYLSHLYDELGSSSPVLVFSVHDIDRSCTKQTASFLNRDFDSNRETLWSQNEAKLVANCLEFSAEYVPLSSCATSHAPSLHVNSRELFHTSSILGVALDVSLMPVQRDLSLAGMLSAIRPAPFACVTGLSCIFPDSIPKFEYGPSMARTRGAVNLSNTWSTQTMESEPRSLSPLGRVQSSCCEVVSACGVRHSLPIFSNLTQPVTIPIPFPRVFDSTLDRNKVNPTKSVNVQTEKGPCDVGQVSVVAGLSTSTYDAHQALLSLARALYSGNRSSRTQLAARAVGVEDEDLHEMSETLKGRAEDYLSL